MQLIHHDRKQRRMHLSAKRVSLANTALWPRSFEGTLPCERRFKERQDDYVL